MQELLGEIANCLPDAMLHVLICDMARNVVRRVPVQIVRRGHPYQWVDGLALLLEDITHCEVVQPPGGCIKRLRRSREVLHPHVQHVRAGSVPVGVQHLLSGGLKDEPRLYLHAGSPGHQALLLQGPGRVLARGVEDVAGDDHGKGVSNEVNRSGRRWPRWPRRLVGPQLRNAAARDGAPVAAPDALDERPGEVAPDPDPHGALERPRAPLRGVARSAPRIASVVSQAAVAERRLLQERGLVERQPGEHHGAGLVVGPVVPAHVLWELSRPGGGKADVRVAPRGHAARRRDLHRIQLPDYLRDLPIQGMVLGSVPAVARSQAVLLTRVNLEDLPGLRLPWPPRRGHEQRLRPHGAARGHEEPQRGRHAAAPRRRGASAPGC
mmetsp:Transcript_20164/g.54964  ORF Transcript_20164/g.54964 Transcript_20164/m.54964 type:complete len:381 (-) Transcript_20164:70-1212(-)